MVTDQMNYAEKKKLMAPALLRPAELESPGLGPSRSEEGGISNLYAQGELCRSFSATDTLVGILHP